MMLSDLIRWAIKNDSIITAYVYGDMGAGKTSYALWVAREVLGSWDNVLDYLFFRPEDVVGVVSRAIHRNRKIPLIIMDDAGTWLDRMTWWEEDKVSFMKFFNLIRSVAHAVIFTTPSEELPKQIIRKCFIRINVRRTTYDELSTIYGDISDLIKVCEYHNIEPIFSLACGYVIKTLPTFIQLVKKDFNDAFPTHYPNDIFMRYERMRREAVKLLLKEWESDLRGKAVNEALAMLEKGIPKNMIVKHLMSRGISRSTAYRLLAKLEGGSSE